MRDQNPIDPLSGLAAWSAGLGPWLFAFLVIRQTRQADHGSVSTRRLQSARIFVARANSVRIAHLAARASRLRTRRANSVWPVVNLPARDVDPPKR